MSIRTIGILTGGGDCAGLNTVIRGVAKCAMNRYGVSVLGILDGFEGLMGEPRVMPLTGDHVKGLLNRGGTIIGTSNKADPFRCKSIVDGKVVITDRSDEVLNNCRRLGLDVLLVVGGDGTNAIGLKLFEKGFPVIGIPKTIDNDLACTDVTFGFDTAVNIVMEALDRLHTTAESHHRVIVVETMGRNAGWIALEAGLAGGADIILLPEIPFHLDKVVEAIERREKYGRKFTIISVAEGAAPAGGGQVIRDVIEDSAEPIRLGGIADQLCRWLEKRCKSECRATVLGHVQRGGAPTAFDRMLCTRLGVEAVHAAMRGQYGYMVVQHNNLMATIPIADALQKPKLVQPDSELVRIARDTGVSFGD